MMSANANATPLTDAELDAKIREIQLGLVLWQIEHKTVTDSMAKAMAKAITNR